MGRINERRCTYNAEYVFLRLLVGLPLPSAHILCHELWPTLGLTGL